MTVARGASHSNLVGKVCRRAIENRSNDGEIEGCFQEWIVIVVGRERLPQGLQFTVAPPQHRLYWHAFRCRERHDLLVLRPSTNRSCEQVPIFSAQVLRAALDRSCDPCHCRFLLRPAEPLDGPQYFSRGGCDPHAMKLVRAFPHLLPW